MLDTIETMNMDAMAAEPGMVETPIVDASPKAQLAWTPKSIGMLIGLTVAATVVADIVDTLIVRPLIIEPAAEAIEAAKLKKKIAKVEKLKKDVRASIDGEELDYKEVDIVDKDGKKVDSKKK